MNSLMTGRKKINAFEMNGRIHQFHQKSSREIWKIYDYTGHNDMLVARALKLGFLTEDEIGEELIGQLKEMFDCWQDDDLVEE